MSSKTKVQLQVLGGTTILILVWAGLLMLIAPKSHAAQPAQIEEIAHTNTLAVYRVQDYNPMTGGPCTLYIIQGVQGIGPTGNAAITTGAGCR